MYPHLPTQPPEGWLPAHYETCTHVLAHYLFNDRNAFSDRWREFAKLRQGSHDDQREADRRFPELTGFIVDRAPGRRPRKVPYVSAAGRRVPAWSERIHKNWLSSGRVKIETVAAMFIDLELEGQLTQIDPQAFVAVTPYNETERIFRLHPPPYLQDRSATIAVLHLANPSHGQRKSDPARAAADENRRLDRIISQYVRQREVEAYRKMRDTLELGYVRPYIPDPISTRHLRELVGLTKPV